MFYLTVSMDGERAINLVQANRPMFYQTRQEAWQALAAIVETFARAWNPVRATKTHERFIALYTADNDAAIFRVNAAEIAE